MGRYVGLIFVIQLIVSVNSQGYGNIEDDSAAPSGNNQQQQLISLPQYDPDPEGYAQAPAASHPPATPAEAPAPPQDNNIQNPGSPSVDQGQSQDYWWMNQNAFQKPAGHPGVEPSDNSAAAPQQQAPARPQTNRAPNSYNAPAPTNNFQNQQSKPQQQARPQQQPQQFRPQQQPQRPQQQQFQQQPGSGWTAPSSNVPAQPSSGFNPSPPSNSLSQPANNFPQSSPVVAAPECQLLNKADCHKRAPQQVPYESEDQGYNSPPQPPQNYRPPPPAQSRPQPAPRPQKPQQPYVAAQPPPGFYQPPPPQPYDTQPQQNVPSNQNYQPQYQSPQSPQSSSFPQSPQRPAQPYRPQSQPQQQQQYNKPAPQQQPQQQYQNNGQYQQPQQQQPNNQYYQAQQQPAVGQPVIGPIDDQAPFPGCPAAMLCVEDDKCNLIGVIEDNLRLSLADKAHRVALSQCSEPSTGIHGVCCRDPDYKDPWPDMNGGGGSGQYQPHHHEDKGHHNNAGQSNNLQQQQQQPQSSFRNPYAEFGDREKKSANLNASSLSKASRHNEKITNNKSPSTNHEFHRCDEEEVCVIHYRCPNKNENGPRKKCKEDIFKNAYHCCKLPESTATSTTTTYRPAAIFTIATSRPLPKPTHHHGHQQSSNNNKSPSPPNPTLDSIYKNNKFLTDTFPPEDDFTTPSPSTESTLITGLGLRFHSHLHTKSAIEANKHRPNPYLDMETGILQEAIVEEEKVPPTFIKTSLTNSGNFSENSSNSITEPQSASSNLRFNSNNSSINVSQTEIIINSTTELPENYTEVYEPAANRTREIIQNFWNIDNHLNLTELEMEKADTKVKASNAQKGVKIPPKPIPLKEELISHPPAGYIFKEYDLHVPEHFLPAGFFQPPKFQYGERQYPIPEDFPPDNTTTIASLTDDDNATTISPVTSEDSEQ